MLRKHADFAQQAAPPPNRTIAIILSGAYRTLTDCNDTIAKHVVDANPWARFEVCAALTADPATDAERRRMEQAVRFGRACIAAVSVESNADVSAAVRLGGRLLRRHRRGGGRCSRSSRSSSEGRVWGVLTLLVVVGVR